MSQRLRKAQERQILHEMLALARFLGARGVPCPQVTEAVKQLRDDLVRAYRAGISTITVDRKSYLVLRSSKGDTIRKEESPKKGVKRCRRSYECEPPRIRRKSAGCASWQQADMGQLIGFCMHASW